MRQRGIFIKDIQNGPRLPELLRSLESAHDPHPRVIQFEHPDNQTSQVIVTGLHYASENGVLLILHGRLLPGDAQPIARHPQHPVLDYRYECQARFNTQTGTGKLTYNTLC